MHARNPASGLGKSVGKLLAQQFGAAVREDDVDGTLHKAADPFMGCYTTEEERKQ